MYVTRYNKTIKQLFTVKLIVVLCISVLFANLSTAQEKKLSLRIDAKIDSHPMLILSQDIPVVIEGKQCSMNYMTVLSTTKKSDLEKSVAKNYSPATKDQEEALKNTLADRFKITPNVIRVRIDQVSDLLSHSKVSITYLAVVKKTP